MLKLVAFLMLYAHLVFAQDDVSKKWRVSPLPVVYYSPETRFGFGALVSANVNLGDSATTTSYLQTSFIYTTNKQYEISNLGRIYTAGNQYIFQYRIYYAFFPEFFHGYQTQTPEAFKELIEYNRLWLELRGFKKVARHFYAGIYMRANRIFNLNTASGGIFNTLAPAGYDGYAIAGIAPAISLDSRDSQVYPRKGWFFEASWMAHPDFISDYSFSNARVDVRRYFATGILRDDVVAFLVLLNLNEGTVPYRDMADVGGSQITRGYYRGYYRYKNLYAAQVEYRWMFNRYLGMATWLGAALVSEQWSEPFSHSLKPNAGLGLRIRINQRDKLNLRADYGFGRNQSGLYLDAAEAF